MLVGAGGEHHRARRQRRRADGRCRRSTRHERSRCSTRCARSRRRPLRYIVNTNEREEHTGGNAAVAATGSTIPFRPAGGRARVSDGDARQAEGQRHLVPDHVRADVGADRPGGAAAGGRLARQHLLDAAEEALFQRRAGASSCTCPATTDGNSIVHFRTADVISVGDLVDLTAYPVIDVKAGGSDDTVLSTA